MPAVTASIFVKSDYARLKSLSFSTSSGRPSDSKLTSIFLDKYYSVNLTGYTESDFTSSTKVSHLAFFLLYKKNFSFSVLRKVAIVVSSTFY